MTPDIRRLYLYHVFLNIALSFMASELYTSNLFLRLKLDKAQFGLIIGVGMFLPALANLLAAPLILRLDIDRQVVAAFNILRILASFLFLVVPMFTRDPGVLTTAFAAIYVLWMTFPFIANNSLLSLIRSHVPLETIGRHTGGMVCLGDFAIRVSMILCAWYMDQYAKASDDEYLRAMWLPLLVTTAFQIPASWLILRLSRKPAAPPDPDAPLGPGLLQQIFEPFRHPDFRQVALVMFAFNILYAMGGGFLFPYITETPALAEDPTRRLTVYVAVNFGLSIAGFGLLPLWGRLADRLGGKNVFSFSMLTCGASFLLLGTDWPWVTFIFAALAWQAFLGIFGTGVQVGQRYLQLATGDPRHVNVNIAAMTLIGSAGYFLGAWAGGAFLEWLRNLHEVDSTATPHAHYRVYFTVCGLMFMLAGLFSRLLRDERRKISPWEMINEFYLELRGIVGKLRG